MAGKGLHLFSDKAEIYALYGWFSAQLSNGIEFGTDPHYIPTQCNQILFPLPKPLMFDPSRKLTITRSPLTEQVGKEQLWYWSVQDGENTLGVNEQELQSQHT